MARCVCCGKKGLFLKVNSRGQCKSCEAKLELEHELAQQKEEIEEKRKQLEELTAKLNDQKALFHEIEAKAQDSARKKIETECREKMAELDSIKGQIETSKRDFDRQIEEAKKELAELKKEVIETDDNILLQSFGIYTPYYAFATSDEYKAKLAANREEQKVLIKEKRAVTSNINWTVEGSQTKGKKMVGDMQKLLLRAYNAECDDAIEHVKFNNIEACEKKIQRSSDAISKLGAVMGIAITGKFERLKFQELRLMHEYQQKKQEEKEAAKELRGQQREEAKVAKELEEQKRKLEKEQRHYQNAYTSLLKQMESANEQQKAALEEKKRELEEQLMSIDKEFREVDYRSANQRAGYVYVISNIGAFGEDVYKIGMTRRLDPTERVYELGDASVPFNFDIHAMIFSDDAPKLEAALHNAFADRKLNFVNQRREFFHVTLDEIKQVVRENYDKTVEFVDVPTAEQYRQSLKLRSNTQPVIGRD